MRLSSTDIYAFKILAHLGSLAVGEWQSAENIAEQTQVPKSYLVRLLAALSTRNVIAARKGKHGGYYLAKPAAEISLLEVMRAMDGPIAPLSCCSLNWKKGCPAEKLCDAQDHIWSRIRDAVIAVLASSSVADLVHDYQNGVDYLLCLDHLLRPKALRAV